jgi:hypothetical protein
MQLWPKKYNPHVFRKSFDLQAKIKETVILKAFPMNSTPKELGLIQPGNIVIVGMWRYSFCFKFLLVMFYYYYCTDHHMCL